MNNVHNIEKNLKCYGDFFNKILKKLCPPIASSLRLEIETGQNKLPDNTSSSQKGKLKWEKNLEIQNMFFSLQVWINDEKEFEEIMSSGYQEDGNHVILDMLIARILDEIIDLLIDGIENSSIQINYPKDAVDLLNQAVMDFAYYIGIPFLHGINYISSMPYEGRQCNGHIVFTKGSQLEKYLQIEFEHKVSFQEKNYRIIRKIMQISGPDKYVVYDLNQAQIIGLVTEKNPLISRDNTFVLEFRGHMHWILYRNKTQALQYINGIYHIIDNDESSKKHIMDLNYYYNGDNAKINRAIELIDSVSEQSHGTMVVISSNAAKEAERLSNNNRAIKIKPVNLMDHKEWIHSITSIDGALILDEDLICYSIGTLLDGPSSMGDIGRGARFNSALSYVYWRQTIDNEKVLAIIVSEDKMINTISEREQ